MTNSPPEKLKNVLINCCCRVSIGQTFLRCPSRSLKISSCSWYSASVSLSMIREMKEGKKNICFCQCAYSSVKPALQQLNMQMNKAKTTQNCMHCLCLRNGESGMSDLHEAWTYSWGRLGFRKGSLSAPFTALVLRCFGSEFVVGAWELLEDGGFLLARSFLCLSMSSLCWFIHSCCLQMESSGFCYMRLVHCSWKHYQPLSVAITQDGSHRVKKHGMNHPALHCFICPSKLPNTPCT